MDIPAELVEEFARGNGAIFVGEGLSVQAGLPSLKQLGAALASEIGCPADKSFQEISRYYKLQEGHHLLVRRLKEQLDVFHLQPTAVHQALLRLPTNYIFTTNYDDLVEKAAFFVYHLPSHWVNSHLLTQDSQISPRRLPNRPFQTTQE